jgi:putative FmdB family regulatory protein
MPNYDYECTRCRKTFEAFQSMKDDAYTICPKDKCRMKSWGKGKVKRLMGAGAGLIFKGSGFYITDYRSEGYKSAAKSAANNASKGDGKSASSSAPTKGEGAPGASSDSAKNKNPSPKKE